MRRDQPENQPGFPCSFAELEARASLLRGRTLAELEPSQGDEAGGSLLRRKGKLGQRIEQILGASAGSHAGPDFPQLGVELKTIPLDAAGKPCESTFVCSFSLADADTAEWESSVARAKLRHVLWVPVLVEASPARIGEPWFWRPSAEQEAVLRADFDDIMGIVAIGKIEELTARVGRWLQARPKAAHARVRTRAYGQGDEPLSALPRGFYLRASFTGALQKDPCTLQGAE